MRATGLAGPLKTLAGALPRRWVAGMPAALLNRTWFSGLVAVDSLPGRRFTMVTDPTTVSLRDSAAASHGGEALALFARLVPGARTFLDIGANTGVYSLIAGVNGVPHVHAFEPVPRIAARLRENLSLNRLDRVRVHDCAVTSHAGTITLYVPAGEMPTEASTLHGFRPAAEPVTVAAVTLDEICAEQRIQSVDLMKVDTESTEPEVFAGGERTLERNLPTIICEVLHGMTEARLHERFDPLGYRYYWLTDRGAQPVRRIEGDPTWRFLNFALVHPARQAAFERAAAALAASLN
ncbi:FkbM family methyltransferase [Schlegelella sp. ID0723]|uniref:FkbM family methyltransferase n=2 Tax=Piscinibacter koreensis TaxID=2742824 RepID=A0A7Y6TUQ1_9BURK|nr:FkbM family methyltransferase [Schlegelella koreensis]